MKNLQLKINTLHLNPTSINELTNQNPTDKYIPEKEVKEYLANVSKQLYGISGLLQTCHESIDDEDHEGYILRKSLALCYGGLDEVAMELEIGENSFKKVI